MVTKLMFTNFTRTAAPSLVKQHGKHNYPIKKDINYNFYKVITSCFLPLTSCFLALVNLPANAAQFQVSGQFAPQASLSKNRPTQWLENGSFKGTFDLSSIPGNDTFLKVNEWDFDLHNAEGSSIFSFSSQEDFQQEYNYQLEAKRWNSGSVISFIFNLFEEKEPAIVSRRFAYFDLFINTPNFAGKINSDSRFADVDTEINYATFSVQQKQYEIKILSGISQPLVVQPVSENMSITGLASVVVLGSALQRRSKLLQRCK